MKQDRQTQIERRRASEEAEQILRLQTPFSIALITNMVVTASIALLAAITAFWAIDTAVERTTKDDITREISLILDRAPERDVISDVAVATSNIGRRLFVTQPDDSGAIYLLTNQSGERIVGNAAYMPRANEEMWIEMDGLEIGTVAGPILARQIKVDDDHTLLVGRRLTARASLIKWYVPILTFGVILLGLCSSLLLRLLNQRYQSKIHTINSVFHEVEAGDLNARIPHMLTDNTKDELGVLSVHVNKALDEVERLLRGLESYSQVAAHELNHSITKLRDRIAETGDTQTAAQADRLIDLVTHILELAKIEATPEFAMQSLTLDECVRSAIDLYADSFEEKTVQLDYTAARQNAEILGSKPLIESAMINLLSNALKHAPPGSKVTISTARNGQGTELSIRDRGPGVDNAELDALAALGREGKTGGHGFGLRHVEAVAIRHGARLVLENANPGLRATLLFQHLS